MMKLGYRPDEAAAVVGSEHLFEEMRAAGWIEPVMTRRKLVLFDFSHIAKCWERICKGETPPPLKREIKRKERSVAGLAS